MWLVIDFILNLLINMIIIFPVFAIAKELFPVPGIDSFWCSALPLLHIPINKNSIFIAELASLILLVCFLWGFVFPYFPVTRFFQRILRGQSKPIPLEQEKINAITNYMEEKGIDTTKYKYFVSSCSEINAFASGAKDITITQPMLSAFSVKELAGIIAHEMGHHQNGDILFFNLSYGVSILNIFCIRILYLIIFLLNIFRFFPFIQIFTILIAFIISIFLNIYTFLIFYPSRLLSNFFNRKIESKSDVYATKIGLGNELIDGLYRLYYFYGKDPWWTIPFSDHPRLMSRIKKLQKRMEKMNQDFYTV